MVKNTLSDLVSSQEGKIYLKIRDRAWNKTYFLRKEIRQRGYLFDKEHREWAKIARTDADIDAATKFCKEHGFQLIIDRPEFRRSSSYRVQFFKANAGLFNHKIYFCSYCGRPMTKKQTTVDHLISIKLAQSSKIVQWLLKKNHIENINDPKNLVPACVTCNQQKGSKTVAWFLKGMVGRHPMVWVSIWILSISTVIGILIKFLTSIVK